MSENQTILWIYNQVMPKIFVSSIILSFISLACNTPQTFEILPSLKYITLVLDIFTGIILILESCFKIKGHGFIKGETPYMKTRWFVFEGMMVLFIWISVILQILEITYIGRTNAPLGLLRIPRALIMLRGFQYLNFQFESGRLAIIVVRSGHQIWGVTLFLLFFLLLYGLLGVQLFGTMSYHCVENGTDPKNVTLSNLAIPDTLCSVDDLSVCPSTFVCMDLSLTIEQKGFGGFDNIFISTKTVYEAASQEGWVFLMYKNIDSYQDWHGYLYFVTLIFFLAWLVKNVFIAVIIETFAEIRVQINNIWGNTRKNHSSIFSQVIESETEQNKWKIIDLETPETGHLHTWRQALRSRWFHISMLIAIVLNVSISTLSPVDSSPYARPWDFSRIAELFFTLVFDLEAVMKVICYGVKGYFKRNIYKYEAFLALVTTFNTTIYSFPVLRSCSVLRIIRLVKLSPTLENFVYKIFGPAKKIGLLVVFTLSILTLASTISLQMLCYVDKLHFFSTFPNAFMSMFQIMTQEGWVDVMHETLILVGYTTYIPVAIYFILYHLFVTTVMISLFVAVILDNLELDESLKRMKQLKVTESSVDFKLPFRLRVFDSFPNKPQMVRLSKMSSEFSLPQVRESFLRQYADDNVSVPRPLIASHAAGLPFPVRDIFATSTAIISSTTFTTRLAVQNDGLPNGYKNYSTFNKFSTAHNVKQRTRFCIMRSNDGLSSFLNNFKNSPKNVEDRPDILNSLLKECSQNNQISENSVGSSSGDRQSILSAQNLMRRDRTFNLTNRRMLNNDGKNNEEDTISTHQDSLFDCNAQHELDFKMIDLKRQQALLKREREEQKLRENHPLFDTPLLFIKRESKFRRLCKYIVNAQYGKTSSKLKSEVNQSVTTQVLDELLGLVTYLDWLMISVTVASCCCMMLETTTTRIHNTPALEVVEYVFVFAIGLELLVKVCANGLLFTPKPAFKDPGGFLDVAIFLISLIFVCSLQSSTGHTGQALMVLRCLRPLKIFKLVPQIRKVVVELFRSIKEIVMVAILLVALMFVFANFGVQLYGGKLAACNDRDILNIEDCHGIFFQHIWISNSLNIDGEPPGFMVPRVWTNPRNFNFDTIGDAMLALFEVLSLKGWIEVRDILVARMGPAHAIYIHLFVFLGCMMGLTLFIGVVIANYNENKGTALLTVDQRRWEDLKSRLKIAQPLHLPPRPPGKCLRARMYDLAENPHFKNVIACCVLIRSLLLSWKWEPSEEYAKYLLNASLCFTFVFVFEIIIKIIGMTFKGMLSSWRNRYDLVVTMMEIIWVAACLIQKDNSSYSTGWCLIMLRFFSICGKHATLKMLLMTVAVSVYRSTFIIIAMFLLLLCYAYAGVVLFGTVKYGENIDRHANFATAPLAMTVLFRIVTGEDWNKIMHDCMIQPPRCTPGEHYWETDCGNVTAALIYFCSFYVILAYIMLNLLVAIIVENFSLFYTLDEDILFSYNDLHRFEVTWNMVDVRRKGTIPVNKVATLLRLLKGRLRIDTIRDHILLKHMCYEMEKIGRSSGNKNGMNGNSSNLKNNDDLVVTFHDVLMMTAYRSVDIRKSLQLEELLMRSKLEAEIEEHVAKETIRKWLEKCVRKYKMQKSKPNFAIELPNDLANITAQQPTIVTSQIDCNDVTDEEKDAEKSEFMCSLKQQKIGKSRKHGICKPPSSYLSASENLLRIPTDCLIGSTFSEYKHTSSCHDNKPLSTLSDSWWNELD